MSVELQDRLERVKTLLTSAKHMAIATVNVDGSPHNTPLFFAFNGTLDRLYWCSSPDSLHSKNVERTGRLFAVIYDSSIGGGLYIKSNDAAMVSSQEFAAAIDACNEKRRICGARELDPDNYIGNATQRIYGATPKELTINMSKKDVHGQIVRDVRHVISAHDLL